MRKVFFATSNEHKAAEIGTILRTYGFEILPRALKIVEPDFDSIEEVARSKALQAFGYLKKPVIVEDTGIFFHAYNNFPGQIAKRVYQGIGFAGLLALIKAAQNKRATFKTVICFARSKKDLQLFSGSLEGRLLDHVVELEKNRLPYEKIFVPDGYSKTLVELDLEEKNKISHRAIAARKCGEWMKENYLY
ncbi:MAG: non-canonical purine NTP pyrophosphatase [Candidatus Diapherotrites archaeon]|nr:non-canonical purine NTP pyrophosphatase [Candidatus Diapherotrites archaeon]